MATVLEQEPGSRGLCNSPCPCDERLVSAVKPRGESERRERTENAVPRPSVAPSASPTDSVSPRLQPRACHSRSHGIDSSHRSSLSPLSSPRPSRGQQYRSVHAPGRVISRKPASASPGRAPSHTRVRKISMDIRTTHLTRLGAYLSHSWRCVMSSSLQSSHVAQPQAPPPPLLGSQQGTAHSAPLSAA